MLALVRTGVCALLLLSLTGCASTPQTTRLLRGDPERVPQSALLPDVPFFAQDRYQCGPAALATLLGAAGITASPDELVPLVYLPALQGSLQPEMLAAARAQGLLVHPLPGTLQALLDEIDAGHPVLVMQNLGLRLLPQWHYAVVKGYDLEGPALILNSGTFENYRVSFRTFERTWQRAGHWGFVALQPGMVPASATAQSYFQAFAQLGGASTPAGREGALRSGLQRWPDDPELQMSLGNLHYEAGELASAEGVFAAIVTRHPGYAPAWNNLAHVQGERGNYAAALANVERALALDSPHAESYRRTRERLLAQQSAAQ